MNVVSISMYVCMPVDVCRYMYVSVHLYMFEYMYTCI